MSTTEAIEIRKPLRLAELLAATIRIYGQRPWAFLALGVVQATVLVATSQLPFAVDLALLAFAFVVSYAVVVRLVIGDSLEEGFRRTGSALPVLVVLGLVVAVPFYLGSAWLVLLVFSVLWLGLTAFAIPAAMAEQSPDPSLTGRVAYALRRTSILARTEFMHAVGVAGALVVIYLVVGVILALALFNFADNGQLAALAIAQVVLAPFFFIGLTVLYFEQQARADEAKGKLGKRS